MGDSPADYDLALANNWQCAKIIWHVRKSKHLYGTDIEGMWVILVSFWSYFLCPFNRNLCTAVETWKTHMKYRLRSDTFTRSTSLIQNQMQEMSLLQCLLNLQSFFIKLAWLCMTIHISAYKIQNGRSGKLLSGTLDWTEVLILQFAWSNVMYWYCYP